MMMSQPVDGPPGSVDGEEASISTVSSSTVDSSSPINAPGTSANRELLDQSRTHNSSRIHQLCAGSTVYVVLASTLAALGGVLFGYDVGIISGALLQLASQFRLDCLQQEMIVSSMLIGALLASVTGGFIIDYCGRRIAIIGNSVIFISGALILSLAQNYVTLIIGRLVIGYGVSLSAIAECVYISEIAPAKHRGLLVSLNELGITSGFLIAYLVNLAFINNAEGWRFMFGLSALPAAVQGIGMIFLPASPRFLMLQGHEEKTRETLAKLRGTTCVETEMMAIRDSLITHQRGSTLDLCRSSGRMRIRLALGLGLVFLQQITGQPNILYYAPTIFLAIGFKSASSAVVSTVSLGIVKLICTIIALLCVDRVGRRKFLLTGTFMMMAAVGSLGFLTLAMKDNTVPDSCSIAHTNSSEGAPLVFHAFTGTAGHGHQQSFSEKDFLERNITKKFQTSLDHFIQTRSVGVVRDFSNGNDTTVMALNQGSHMKWLTLIALMTFVAGYAVGFGPVSWLVLSEIYPSHLRGRAISIATICNWGTNLLISMTFLDILRLMTVPGTFLMYAVICAVAIIFIYICLPETKGRTLEQISLQLNHSPLAGNIWCCRDQSESRMRLNESMVEEETHYDAIIPQPNLAMMPPP